MAEAESNHSLEFKSCEHTHFDHLLRSATLLHFMTMEYITSYKGGRKLAFGNNIYIKQKVLSNGTVWGDIMGGFCPGGFCPGGFCPRGYFVQGDFVRGGFVRGDFVLEPNFISPLSFLNAKTKLRQFIFQTFSHLSLQFILIIPEVPPRVTYF